MSQIHDKKKDNLSIDTYISYIKDAVYIIGLIVVIVGWIVSNAKSTAILESTVKYNTETISKLESFINKQSILNDEFSNALKELKQKNKQNK